MDELDIRKALDVPPIKLSEITTGFFVLKKKVKKV